LLLVGDGPEAHLRARAQAEGLRNVVFGGFVQKPDLPRYYTMADAFVFPTLGDPYGLVVDEAMACSLPVISTSAAGEIGDRVEDGVNGYIVPPENSAALLDRMERLAHDNELRSRMGEASARKIAGRTGALGRGLNERSRPSWPVRAQRDEYRSEPSPSIILPVLLGRANQVLRLATPLRVVAGVK
jgi:glycosyltransferase involved in cell wall biosynthesis